MIPGICGDKWKDADGCRKRRVTDPVTRILFLNASTCRDLVWRGLVSMLTKDFPMGGNPPEQSQLSALLLFHLPFFLLSVSQTRRKRGRGQKEENLTCLDRAHVCLLKNSRQYQLWPTCIDETRLTSCARIVRVCADAWERRQLRFGMWLTFRLFKMSVFT